MTVTITKPNVNIREKLAELDRPVGNAGSAMLRAETVEEQRNLIGAGRRNILINGGFTVSQRGDFTSAQTLGTGFTYYTDRWKTYAFNNDLGYVQHKLDQVLPDGSTVNTLRVTSGVANLKAPLVQMIEDHKALWGREFTTSFWYRSTSDMNWNLWNGTSQEHFDLPNTQGEWVKYQKSFKFKENGAYARVEFYSYSPAFHTDTYFEVANVQLELGSVATPFEQRSYGEELALCQRYFCVMPNAIFGIATSTTAVLYSYHLPVTMRTTPAVSLTSTNQRQGDMVSVGIFLTNASVSNNAYTNNEVAAFQVTGSPNPSSFTPYRTYLYEGVSSHPAQVHLSAEL